MKDEVVEDLAAGRVLHHQVEGLLRLYHLEQLDNVGVVQGLHDPDFPEQLLEASRVQLSLVDYFDRHLQKEEKEKLLVMLGGGGGAAQLRGSTLAPHTVALGLIQEVRVNFSEEKLCMLLRLINGP